MLTEKLSVENLTRGICMRARVTLEPELETEVVLFTPAQRMELAKKLKRWARQLEVSAVILRRASAPKPRPSLKALPRRKLFWN
jgi:hypothetical protein